MWKLLFSIPTVTLENLCILYFDGENSQGMSTSSKWLGKVRYEFAGILFLVKPYQYMVNKVCKRVVLYLAEALEIPD